MKLNLISVFNQWITRLVNKLSKESMPILSQLVMTEVSHQSVIKEKEYLGVLSSQIFAHFF